MSAALLERGNWIDKSIDLYIGTLVEYDMRDGGLSIIKEFKLLPPYMIDQIAALPKGIQRNSYVGKLRHNDTYKDIPAIQNQKFKELRILFGEKNDLADEDIFAVRKDAIFTKRFCYTTKLGEYIEFREKNVYDAFMRIGKIEFYWRKDSKDMDVKGFSSDSNLIHKHDGYMNSIIWEFIRYLASFDEDGARKYIVSIIDKYKFFKLDPGCYRTYDNRSGYPMIINGNVQLIEDVGISEIPYTDIGFNFQTLLVPMLQLVDR